MKIQRVVNATRSAVLCERCGIADNPLTRIRGLLGRPALPAGEGLLIVPCPSIHMFGMKFAIDVVFLTRDYVVTDVVENIAPGRVYSARGSHGKAHSALELSAGAVAASGTAAGDRIELQPLPASSGAAPATAEPS